MLQKFTGLKVKAEIYNLDGTLKYTKEIAAEVDEDGTKECFVLPKIDGLSSVYFVRLELKNAAGAEKKHQLVLAFGQAG